MPINPLFAVSQGTSPVSTPVDAGPRAVLPPAATRAVETVGEQAWTAAGDGAGDDRRASLQQAAEALTRHYQQRGAELRFHVDQDLQRLVVTVRDTRDGSVIRQIPGAEALRLARMLDRRAPQLLHHIV